MLYRDLQFAGYSRPSDGTLGRPVPSGLVIVPEFVELRGDLLRWGLGEYRFAEFSRKTLNGFLGLWAAGADAICGFARSWGVLMMQGDAVLRPCGDLPGAAEEPLDPWRYYSRRAAAVLGIAASLKQDRLGDAEDWAQIALPHKDMPPFTRNIYDARYGMKWAVGIDPALSHREKVLQARAILESEINDWMTFWRTERDYGFNDLSLYWDDGKERWTVQVDYHGFLFAAIALQLALVVAEADSLYICSGCARPYVRGAKRPKPGWANYCGECTRGGVAERKAAQDYRERKSEARRLSESGVSVAEISSKLAVPAARVRGWLKKTDHGKTKTRK